MTSRFHAWGDESIRLADSHPVYLLAATISDLGECESIRASLRAVPFTGTKLHWRDLDDGRRRSAAELVAGLDLLHVVVVGEMAPPASQERMRALCLERLAWELDDEGVGGLTLEARPPSLMRRDMRTIDALRGKRALPRGLRVDHAFPSDEPMLWIADQVLGALGESLTERSTTFEVLRPATRILRLVQG